MQCNINAVDNIHRTYAMVLFAGEQIICQTLSGIQIKVLVVQIKVGMTQIDGDACLPELKFTRSDIWKLSHKMNSRNGDSIFLNINEGYLSWQAR